VILIVRIAQEKSEAWISSARILVHLKAINLTSRSGPLAATSAVECWQLSGGSRRIKCSVGLSYVSGAVRQSA
jgi:hypothetical protein